MLSIMSYESPQTDELVRCFVMLKSLSINLVTDLLILFR